MLNAQTLSGYKLLIILRDGMIWPNGYPDEMSNAGWLKSGEPKLISDPPVPSTSGKAEFWMKPEQGRAVRSFVDQGGAALFLHNVTHIGLTDPDFRQVMGAGYAGHPPVRTFRVKVKNPNHPITKGSSRLHGYRRAAPYMKYDKDPKDIFAIESVNESGLTFKDLGSSAPAGCAYDFGKGRI